MPTKSLCSKKAQPNARRQLKVQQLLIPEIEKLQQKELQAQQPLSINKTARQIPQQQVKPQVKPKKSAQKNKVKPKVKQLTLEAEKEPSLAKRKREMVEWLENVKIN